MYARKRFDIGWLDLASALSACVVARDEAGLARRVERWFGPEGDAFACLSVRSGLELYLETLALPRGSEVLMSALTIPDMARVVEHHGLVVVPVDVDPETLAPRPEAWLAACTARTKLAIVAHLFGTRIPLDPLVQLRRERGILVLEDDAQAFTGTDFLGDPSADVSMFSFGPIKTATALAGAVLRVRDHDVLARMRAAHAEWPLQSRPGYTKRIFKYALLKSITSPVLYSLFVRSCAAVGKDIDTVIQGTVRGFAGGELFVKIRHRPSAPLLALLARRLGHADGRRVAARTRHATRLIERAGTDLAFPGSRAPIQSFWVFTVLSSRPEELVARLRERGFDATRKATLSAIPAPPDRPELDPHEARSIVARLVYLPVYPELPLRRLDQMADVLRSIEHEAVGSVVSVKSAKSERVEESELEGKEVSHTQLA